MSANTRTAPGEARRAGALVKRVVRILLSCASVGWIAIATPAAAADPPKRPTPDYDGRGGPDTTPGDVVLWVPRLALSPIYLTHEFLVRRPVGALVIAVEKNNVVSEVIDFFTFDKEHKVGLVPTAFIDFGFLPSVGLYFFWNDLFEKKNNFHAQASTWGPDWLKLSVGDSIPLAPHASVALGAQFVRRSDQLYYGIGSRTLESSRSRYQVESIDVNATYESRVARGVHLQSQVGFRDTRFADQGCCDDPTLVTETRARGEALPPGFADGYTLGYQRLELALDSRMERPTQTGVRLDLEAQPTFNAKPAGGQAWFRYGGTVAGFVDLTGHRRVLSLALTGLFVDPIRGGDIPFTEQIVLGGLRYMRGYKIGRLIDRSAAIATLEYQWPLWVWLDGTMHAAVGNVFGAGLSGFDVKSLRLSSGIGFRTTGSPESQFEFLLGFGTETFADGGKVTSARLAIGGTYGF